VISVSWSLFRDHGKLIGKGQMSAGEHPRQAASASRSTTTSAVESRGFSIGTVASIRAVIPPRRAARRASTAA